MVEVMRSHLRLETLFFELRCNYLNSGTSYQPLGCPRSVMCSLQLVQGTFEGVGQNGVDRFHGIPYAQPFDRFQPPRAIGADNSHQSGRSFGANPPQRPSRLEVVMGPMPPDSGPQDEAQCGVLSVYRPQGLPNGCLAPVIVWVHGGAFVSGGSQTPWYDGSRLCRDSGAVVVAINYRLGVFGFLYDEEQSMPLGIQDVILSFEWVRDNIRHFGGDPDNITAYGQSAGAYIIQLLIDPCPDLFHRAIIQSSPAELTFTRDQAENVRQAVVANIPRGKTLDEASTEDLLDAQVEATRVNVDSTVTFAPVVTEPPGGHLAAAHVKAKKDILVGWTHDDGSCFAYLGSQAFGMPKWMRDCTAKLLGESVTEIRFRRAALNLADRLREQGHRVTTFEVTWAPPGFPLGATHTIDVPLVFGDKEAFKNAPLIGDASWEEWERRGKPFRQALGRFARDGSPISKLAGVCLVEERAAAS